MKGIILAGGSGTRLHPLTSVVSKQLLPVYDKPMIYYPLSTLLLAGIKDILIISTPHDITNFEKLLGDGHQFGIKLRYSIQESPDGLAQAFIIGEDFIGNDTCAMILGDNIFYGNGFTSILENAVKNAEEGFSTIFSYYVDDPHRFGIVEFDENFDVISVEEKPANPKSNYCITGLYFYDKDVVSMAKKVQKSKRGEYEITDLNNLYLQNKALKVQVLGRGYAWFDTGTKDSLLKAGNFVQMIENMQGIKISVPEEISYRKNWITNQELSNSIHKYGNSPYAKHLKNVLHKKYI